MYVCQWCTLQHTAEPGEWTWFFSRDLAKRNFACLFSEENLKGYNRIGYVSRNHAVNLVRNKLAACANSSSSSGPVLPWFEAIKSCRIFDRTLFDPWSHCCSNLLTAAWSVFILKSVFIMIKRFCHIHCSSLVRIENQFELATLHQNSNRKTRNRNKIKRKSRLSTLPVVMDHNKANLRLISVAVTTFGPPCLLTIVTTRHTDDQNDLRLNSLAQFPRLEAFARTDWLLKSAMIFRIFLYLTSFSLVTLTRLLFYTIPRSSQGFYFFTWGEITK